MDKFIFDENNVNSEILLTDGYESPFLEIFKNR